MGARPYYVDDLVLFADDKPTLWARRDAVVERLTRLRLTIHPGAHPRPVSEGIPFLGFTIFPNRRRLKRRKGIHFRRKFKRLLRAYGEGGIELAAVTDSVQGWVNHVRYGNTIGLREAVLGAHAVPSRGAT